MIKDEGYIKFRYDWIPAPIPKTDLSELIYWRQQLYQARLIGAYPNGIGYGNVSIRYQDNQFIISASGTGNKAQLDDSDFALVDEFDIDKNWLNCIGNSPASSESLSHAAIYSTLQQVNAVVHIHHLEFWKKQLNVLPTSRPEAKFGTPEMAYSLKELIEKKKEENGIIIMGGHEEGILFYGNSLAEIHKSISTILH
jgi:ribulose-5-phosphate 4-epimerase/fuculose-1-phosphate aldolase